MTEERMSEGSRELDEVLGAVAGYFAVLADANRLKIMHALCDGERSVGEIVRTTGIAQTNVSRHLSLMRLKGTVSRRRDGKQIRYRITDDTMPELCRTVCARMATALDERRPLKRGLMRLVEQAGKHAA